VKDNERHMWKEKGKGKMMIVRDLFDI